MKNGRVKNVSRNMAYGTVLRIYQILTPFIIRTIMLYFMGAEYLGLNSLFTSVLQVLNLAELGIGSAMVFSMYAPIVEHDSATICALMRLYKIYYRVIGTVILVAGLIIMPFIPKLINGDIPSELNIYVLYLLNLLVTALSYWLFAYKNCLLTAHERNDIVSKVYLITGTIQYVLQIIVLVLFQNYYAFLALALFSQILNNLLTAYQADKLYPQYQPRGELAKEKVKQINQKVKDLFTSKIGGVVVGSVGTIVISAFLGLTELAIYQNYLFVLTAVMGVNQVIYKACLASIGNSIVTESKEKILADFRKISLVFAWLVGFCTVSLACLFQPFMEIWVGKELMLKDSMVWLFCIYFYVYEFENLFSMYKDAAGMWHRDRFRPLILAVSTLVLDLILVQFIGLYGILISTIVSLAVISLPWLYHNLFSEVFGVGARAYGGMWALCTGIIVAVTAMGAFVCSIIPLTGILGLAVRLLICLIPVNGLFFVLFYRIKGFDGVLGLINRITGKTIFKLKKRNE